MAFVAVCSSFNLLFNAHWKQWPGMTVTAAVGYTLAVVLDGLFTPETVNLLSAMGIGVMGIIWSKYSPYHSDSPLVIIISGVLMLVPGGISVRGATALLSNNVVDGLSFGFVMLVTGLSISVGLFVARLIVFPIERVSRQIDSLM